MKKSARRYDGDLYCPDCYHTPLEVLGDGYYFCDKCGHQPHISELDTSGKNMRRASEILRNLESRIARLEKSAKSHSTNIHKVVKELCTIGDHPIEWNLDEGNFAFATVEEYVYSPDYASEYEGKAELVYNFKKGVKVSTINKYIKVLTSNKNISDLIYEDGDMYDEALFDEYVEQSWDSDGPSVESIQFEGLRVNKWKIKKSRLGYSLVVIVNLHITAEPPEDYDPEDYTSKYPEPDYGLSNAYLREDYY